MLEQIKQQPKFTQYGYKKMQMPKDLHQFILDTRNILKDTKYKYNEQCREIFPLHNCQKVQRDGTIGKVILLKKFPTLNEGSTDVL